MAYATLSCEGPEDLEIAFIEAERDLLRARWVNLDVEILQIFCELLHAVTRPEITLVSVAPERWDLALLRGACTH
jgi:hypothetical protein